MGFSRIIRKAPWKKIGKAAAAVAGVPLASQAASPPVDPDPLSYAIRTFAEALVGLAVALWATRGKAAPSMRS